MCVFVCVCVCVVCSIYFIDRLRDRSIFFPLARSLSIYLFF